MDADISWQWAQGNYWAFDTTNTGSADTIWYVRGNQLRDISSTSETVILHGITLRIFDAGARECVPVVY